VVNQTATETPLSTRAIFITRELAIRSGDHHHPNRRLLVRIDAIHQLNTATPPTSANQSHKFSSLPLLHRCRWRRRASNCEVYSITPIIATDYKLIDYYGYRLAAAVNAEWTLSALNGVLQQNGTEMLHRH